MAEAPPLRARPRSQGPRRLLRPFACAAGRRPDAGFRRVLGGRPQRHGQDHAVQDHHGPVAGERRLGSRSRRGYHPPQPGADRAAGVGYVPQGRRLWRSLSVAEHLSLAAGMRRGAWTIDRIYETFPRLAERKDHGGGQLSGGEQQMLAISRALLTNPHLLIMDEPTEGLAPVIVAQVEEMLVRLGEDGEMSVLVIEQNIGVATAISKNVAIMVNGRINRIINSARLAADRELQQRLLGVGRWRHAEPETDIEAADAATPRRVPHRRAPRVRRQSGSTSPIPRCRRAGRSRRPLRASRPQRARFRPALRGSKTPPGKSARPARRYKARQDHPSSSSPARSIPRARSCASFAT